MLATVVIVAALIALFAWSPWVKPTEAEWLGAYEAWSDENLAALAQGRTIFPAACDAAFDEQVGDPPSERLDEAATAARSSCGATSPAAWRARETDVVRALMAVHAEELSPRQRPDLTAIARSQVGVAPDVYCWRALSWADLAPQYAILREGEEVSLRGIVDPRRNRIDLDPGICATLNNYLRGIRPLTLSSQYLELAEALSVLTHQAEHLKAPGAAEAEIECYALQHVRPLVAAAGWEEEITTEVALQAWEIAYPRVPPHFRTRACRNGGPLDRDPRSSEWP